MSYSGVPGMQLTLDGGDTCPCLAGGTVCTGGCQSSLWGVGGAKRKCLFTDEGAVENTCGAFNSRTVGH